MRLSLRRSNRGSVSYRVAILCVAALNLLLARSAPPSFPHMCRGISGHAHANDDHRQRFDNEKLQWGPGATLIARLTVVSQPPISTAPHIGKIVADGWQHNRPPPIDADFPVSDLGLIGFAAASTASEMSVRHR